MIKIQKATLEDVQKLEEVNILAKNDTGWWIPQYSDFYKKFLENKNNEIQIAYNNSEIIGFVSIDFNPERKSVWLNDIYVKQNYREKGVARQLIEKVLDNWKTKSNSIVLLTKNKNLPIFEKLGFKKTMNFMEYKNLKK